ncbi:GNAT family N-acetyltransferase [uncultured Friedmanniella sp.]|uniref:GNAT family N-acetyltransferase n=1 Tax=uncultured Friedmanniella sp. TaxID=335381 RepID=UPI0035C9B646
MEANTAAIIRLGWSRLLGLPDDSLDPVRNPVRTVRADSEREAMVVRLWDTYVVVGPEWLHERVAETDPAELLDQSKLLRRCEGHRARVVGQAVLAYTDRYVQLPGLREVPVDDGAAAAVLLEKSCPPDDVSEVGLAEFGRIFVILDERDAPTAGAGYDEWQGILGHLGALTAPEHRRTGRGTVAAALALNDALDVGLVAQWRARVDNVGSRRLARRLGFTEVGAQTTVALT